MCKWTIPLQYAYTDPFAEPGREFKRFETPIISDAHLKAARQSVDHTSEYISVYGWEKWIGGRITPEISKTAYINKIFLDFDDADNPLKAIRDAAEVAAYVGHCTCNFSGAKGAHVLIHCYPVDLMPDLKSSVLRGFANMLAEHLPELSTMDWSVIGDTSRVHRIINSVHPKTKLHAIGLTVAELATLTINEIRVMAANRRELIQVPAPSQWVSDELYRIEKEIVITRAKKLYDKKMVSDELIELVTEYRQDLKEALYSMIASIEDDLRRIREEKAKNQVGMIMDRPIGHSPAETWLLKVVDIFKVTQRMNSIQPSGSKVSTSSSEQEARCHIAHLMDDCGWDRERMHDVFRYADDYDRVKTDRQLDSLIGGVTDE